MKHLFLLLAVCCCFMLQAQIFDITHYGALGDGVTINTLAIQAAIDSCHNAGGGIVEVPSGNFVTGTLVLKSNVTINLLSGATILGSTSMSDYPDMVPQIRSYADNYPQKSIFYAENQHHIGITGQGTVNGQGLSVTFLSVHSKSPLGFRFLSCSNVVYRGVTLLNSAFWMMHNFNIDTLSIANLHIVNQAYGNNDGIDLDGCRNVLVDSCTADCNDDAIVLKTTAAGIGNDHIEIRNCTVATYSRAIKIGTETFGPTSNIYIHDCQVVFSTAGVFGSHQAALGGINLSAVNGGSLQNILVENIGMTGVGAPVFIRLGLEQKTYDTLPQPSIGFAENIRLNNITAVASTDTSSSISGVPGFPVRNIQLSNISITYPGGWPALPAGFSLPENVGGAPQATIFGDTLPGGGLYCRHVDSLLLQNICFHALRPDGRPALYLDTNVANLDSSDIGNCGTAGLKAVENSESIRIFPNPASEILTIFCPGNINSINLIAEDGRVMESFSNLNCARQDINLKNLAKGIYLVQLRNYEGYFYKRVQIE